MYVYLEGSVVGWLAWDRTQEKGVIIRFNYWKEGGKTS